MNPIAAVQMSDMAATMRSVVEDADGARGIPNAAYTDARLFDFERDEVFARTWAAIGYASSVPEPGCAQPVDFMGIPLLLIRNRQAGLRVFHNVCSHRGMQLVQSGARLKTTIRCPYHSWSYDFDGELLSTPFIGGVDKNSCDGFDRSKHGLKPVRFAVWMDIVFVNLSGDAEEFGDYIAALETRWQPFIGRQDRSAIGPASDGSSLELEVRCNWKLAVENYCEAYHLPWVHPALNAYSPLDQHFHIIDSAGMSGQGTHVYELATAAGTRLPTIEGWPEDRLASAEYLSLYPNALLGLQADHLFSVVILPKAANRSVEQLQISYIGDALEDDAFASCRRSVLDSWDKVFREDVFAVEGMQAGRSSPGFDGGVLTPVQDLPTRHFHRWVANRYLQALPTT